MKTAALKLFLTVEVAGLVKILLKYFVLTAYQHTTSTLPTSVPWTPSESMLFSQQKVSSTQMNQ
jgi:hypothetical protein